jgi:2-methylcitrate dehydratase PrpD
MDAAYAFAKNFVETDYKKIPKDAVDVVKKDTLDLLAVALAGSSKPGMKELEAVHREWGGKEESTVFCFGGKMPAPNAAQVNATMGHALDYDDTHDVAIMHPSVISVPTGLALAERQGKLSGKEYIAASAVAMDMICRMGLATTSPRKTVWHLTTLNGFMTAAGMAGKILGLDENGIINAIGIAYHQSSGNGQCVIDGALTKRMGPGFAVRGGISAALMAEKGITGSKNSLEGEDGFFNIYHNGIYNAEILTADLGKHFEGANVSIKPYPCCRGIHSYIDAIYEIAEQHNLKADDVEEIIVTCGKVHNKILCDPIDVKRRPRTVVDSQFSTPWGIATALVRGKVALEHFTETAIKDQDILAISTKVNVELEDNPAITGLIEPGKLKFVTKKGETYYTKIDFALGSPQRPLSYDQCADKFRDCASYAINQISGDRTETVIEMIRNLENVDDIGEISRLLG